MQAFVSEADWMRRGFLINLEKKRALWFGVHPGARAIETHKRGHATVEIWQNGVCFATGEAELFVDALAIALQSAINREYCARAAEGSA
jgi:hypothetical protein